MTLDPGEILSGGALAAAGTALYQLVRFLFEHRTEARKQQWTHEMNAEQARQAGLESVVAELRKDNERLRAERQDLGKEAEHLRIQLAEIRAQSDELPLPMMALGSTGRTITWCNAALHTAWCVPLGLNPQHVCDRPIGEVFTEEIALEIAGLVAAAMATPDGYALVEGADLPGIAGRWHIYAMADRKRRVQVVGWVILAIPRAHSVTPQ